ncbi:MAG: hypothetical protein ACI4M6_01360 [Christensenellaceae bacterium]
MSNEKIKNETNQTVEKKLEEPKLIIAREPFTSSKNGETYYAYVLRGKARGRDVKVDFVPKDIGGYVPLDIVFDGLDTAELVISEEKMTDDNGNKVSYTTYSVRNIDEDGNVWQCPVKPTRGSDKSLLDMLLLTLKINKNS